MSNIWNGLLSLGVLFGAATAWGQELAPAPPSPDERPSPLPGEDRPLDVAPIPEPVDLRAFDEQIDRALKRLASEPTLRELERAALLEADADRESTSRWRRAPRLSAMLPTLKVTADYDMGRDEALDRYQEKPDRWGADTDRGYGFQVSAQWHLNELVFNPDEIRAYDALADRASRRETLLNLLIGYYFERRRLQLEDMLTSPSTVAELIERRLRIRQLTESIDALTGGLLSRKIYQSGTKSP